MQLFNDVLGDLTLVVSGEDQRLHVDVLLVHTVLHRRGAIVENDGVDHDLHIEHRKADGVEDDVENQAHTTHRNVDSLFVQIQSNDIQSAAAGAAGKYDTVANTGKTAADEAGRPVIRDQRSSRSGDQTVEEGIAAGADNGLDGQFPSKALIGDEQDGRIDEEEQHARNVGIFCNNTEIHMLLLSIKSVFRLQKR